MFLTASTEHLDTTAAYYQMTPLHAAVSRGHSRTVSVLASFGAYVNALDSDNRTPLHYAAKSGHFKCANVRAFPPRGVALSCRCAVTALSRTTHEPGSASHKPPWRSPLLTHSRHCGLTRAQPPALRAPGTADAAGCWCAQAFG